MLESRSEKEGKKRSETNLHEAFASRCVAHWEVIYKDEMKGDNDARRSQRIFTIMQEQNEMFVFLWLIGNGRRKKNSLLGGHFSPSTRRNENDEMTQEKTNDNFSVVESASLSFLFGSIFPLVLRWSDQQQRWSRSTQKIWKRRIVVKGTRTQGSCKGSLIINAILSIVIIKFG